MDIAADPTPDEIHAKYVAGLRAELEHVGEPTSYINDEDGRKARVSDIKDELKRNGVDVDEEQKAVRAAAAKSKSGTETAVAPGVK